MGYVIGIDLGTTYSSVAICRNQSPEVIVNDQGSRTTPSCVAFTEEEELVGEAAYNQLPLNISNTVYGVKRLIGRKFQDNSLQNDIKNWPFKVVHLGDDKPKVMVNNKNENVTYFPEEISCRILKKMKEYAEAFLGEKVTKAVITVPAYFENAQRQATKVAGRLAGLEVLRIINEPTAAALAFGIDKGEKEKQNILIYDLGGGTFDVSIVTLEDGVFDVRSTSGNLHLGGEDFTNRLVEYFIEDIKKKLKRDISSDMTARAYLRIESDKAKRHLSNAMEAVVHLNSPGINYNGKITRANFDHLSDELFRSTLNSVEDALKNAKMNKSEIDNVVLVGGSTRIPRIRNILVEYFGQGKITTTINPDEAVAMGAAIQAALLSDDAPESLIDIVLHDIMPHSLGTDIEYGEMSVILPRNTKIPAKETKTYTTVRDNQTSVSVAVFEGENKFVRENNQIGNFHLNGLRRAPKKQVKIEVTFGIDTDGILNVSAKELGNDNYFHNIVVVKKDHYTDDYIKDPIENLENRSEVNESNERLDLAKKKLEDFCLNTKVTIQSKNTNDCDKETILKECDDALRWLRSTNVHRVEDVEKRLRMLSDYMSTVHMQ